MFVCVDAGGSEGVDLFADVLDLHMLHTDPAYQGCGAGSALVEHVKRRADELGLPVYLESSGAAHGFYRKRGFEDVEMLELDFSRFGGPERYQQPLMIREPGVDVVHGRGVERCGV
jgi:GNAT superfamily N-acetyltransferase